MGMRMGMGYRTQYRTLQMQHQQELRLILYRREMNEGGTMGGVRKANQRAGILNRSSTRHESKILGSAARRAYEYAYEYSDPRDN